MPDPAEEQRKAPRAPAGLAARGRSLWRDVMGAYELRDDELRTLEAACRLADELGRLEAELKQQPTMVLGSQGQMRANPLFSEARNHRLALQKLLTALQLPEEPGSPRSEAQRASHNGRAMALSRWGRRNG